MKQEGLKLNGTHQLPV